MAYLDPNDPYAQPYPQPSADPGVYDPNTNPNGTQSLQDAVAQMYRTALGREASPAEIQATIQGGSGDLVSIQKAIYASPEAIAYGKSRSDQTKAPDPTTPNPTTTTTTPTPTPTGPAPTPVLQSAPTAPGSGGTPAYTPPPAFSYDPFVAPTADDLKNDPGYQFEFNQGLQAIGAKNAALGTLNTGGTIKDFQAFGDNLASTKYNDLWNRKANEYAMNRGNAVDAYNTNYGTQYKDPFSFGLQGAELNQNNNQFNAQLGTNTNQYNSNMDWQKFLQTYKSTVTDPFQQKISLLGLL